ncbi:MAG TPA: nucleotidyltransferase domain-containing protein [Tepidisphaeraceae bacterium]|jgi:hypothetical protein
MAFVMIPLIEQNREAIVALCVKYGVKRLELFGSAARGEDFDPDTSDVDFFYILDNVDSRDLADRFFMFAEDLERLLGRRVDLVSLKHRRNPYFILVSDRSRIVLHAA